MSIETKDTSVYLNGKAIDHCSVKDWHIEAHYAGGEVEIIDMPTWKLVQLAFEQIVLQQVRA